jgi:hypothetical protein
MPQAEFEPTTPVFEREKTDSAASVISGFVNMMTIIRIITAVRTSQLIRV